MFIMKHRLSMINREIVFSSLIFVFVVVIGESDYFSEKSDDLRGNASQVYRMEGRPWNASQRSLL